MESRDWVQRLAFKSNLDKVPVTVEVSWDGYTDHSRPAPKQKLVAMSATVSKDEYKRHRMYRVSVPPGACRGCTWSYNCQDRQTRLALSMVTRSLSAWRPNNVGEPGPHHADWPPNGTVQAVGGAVWLFGAGSVSL